ncbi:MAG: hypothetical protein WKF88_04365 [Ferruginibacter sp.]
MKIISKIIMSALLLTSGAAFAQKSNSRGNGTQKVVVITDKKTTGNSNGVINANEHASTTGKMHANSNSVLIKPAITTTTTYKKHKKHHRKKMIVRRVN